jgi:hypothetical protein
MRRWPSVKVAGAVQAVGMDGVSFLRADPTEALVWVAIAEEAAELHQRWRKEQALLVVNMLGKAMKK